MRGKNEDGTFQSPFSPLKWGDAFTEGNSWHYSWSVFHYSLNIFSEIPFYRLSLYIRYLQMFSFGLNTHEISRF